MCKIIFALATLVVEGGAFARFESTAGKNYDKLFHEYSSWHSDQLSKGHCASKLSLVWKPEAGIGDAAYSLAMAYSLAIRTGRLFFVDWSMPLSDKYSNEMSWREVITPAFQWDYGEAKSAGLICPEDASASAKSSPIIFMIDMDVIGGKVNGKTLPSWIT